MTHMSQHDILHCDTLLSKHDITTVLRMSMRRIYRAKEIDRRFVQEINP